MNRVALVVLFVVLTTAAARAQVTSFSSPAVDVEIPAGSVALSLQRVTPPAMLKGQPLGARWNLELAGFGNPIVLDGRPAVTMPPSSGFTDKTDARKRLASRTDRRGNAVSIAYDGQGRVTTINGPKSVVLTFARDRAGRVMSIRTPRGDVTYAYVNDDLSSVSVNGGAPIRYAYGTAAGPVRIDDPIRGTMDLSYDASGRVSVIRHADGSVEPVGGADGWSSVFDASSRTVTETDPAGAATRITYDTRDRVVAIVDPMGARTSYEYDAAGRLSAVLHPDGIRQTYRYDAAGSLVEERLADQLVRAIAYHPDGTVASLAAAGQPALQFAYTPQGQLQSRQNALGQATTYSYDARGNRLSETDPGGATTRWTYDSQNRPTSETDPAGGVIRWSYDARGLITEVADRMGVTRRLEYDARGRTVSETDAAGQPTRFAYDAAGNVARISRPGGRIEQFTYDAKGRVVRAIDERGRETSFTYDSSGRLSGEVRADGVQVQYRYNAAGALIAQTDSAGYAGAIEVDTLGRPVRLTTGNGSFRYAYDASGRITLAVDPGGASRTVAYSADGAMLSVRDALNNEVRYDHDAAARLVAVRRASGGRVTFAYDAGGRLVGATDPLGNTRKYGYDGLGRTTSTTDETGATSTLSYDNEGRLTARQLGPDTNLSFRRDAVGRVVEATDGVSPVRFTYDAAGRVIATEFAAVAKTIRATFDEQGNRTSLVDADGRTVRYEYGAGKWLSAIQLPDGSRLTYTYNASGQRTIAAYPNGVRLLWRYDSRSRIEAIDYIGPDGKPFGSRAYAYNPAGDVTEVRDAARTVRYGYDAAGQLVEEIAPGVALTYQYGPGGNRTSRSQNGQAATYQYDANDRLVRVESPAPAQRNRPAGRITETLEWDARGTLQRRGSATTATRYEFDRLQRLTRVTAPDGNQVSYGYDALGNRITRRDRAGSTQFLYDGLNLIQELDERGQTRAAFVHGDDIDRPVAMLRGGQAYFLHPDRYGSIIFVTDSRGRVVSSYDYDAFGQFRARTEGVPNPFGFAGREFDAATSLYNFRARYYDAAIGRFISPDPAGTSPVDPNSYNPYPYAKNAPTRYLDPLGRSPDLFRNFFGTTIEQQIEFLRTVHRYNGQHAAAAAEYLVTAEAFLAEQGPRAPAIHPEAFGTDRVQLPRFNPNDVGQGEATPSRPNPAARQGAPSPRSMLDLGERPADPAVLRPNGADPIRPINQTNPGTSTAPPGRSPTPTTRIPRPEAPVRLGSGTMTGGPRVFDPTATLPPGARVPDVNATLPPAGAPSGVPIAAASPSGSAGGGTTGANPPPAARPGIRDAINNNPTAVNVVVFTVTVMAQCYKNNWDAPTCLRNGLVALGITATGQIAISYAGKTIGTAIGVVGVTGAMVFTVQAVVEAFDELDRGVAAMDNADKALMGYLQQLQQRLGALAKRRQELATREQGASDTLLRAERAMERIRTEIDAVEEFVKGMSGGTSLCEDARRHQDALRGARSEARRKLTELDGVIVQMTARARACKTDADSLAIRTGWSRAQALRDDINRLYREGDVARQRMLDAIKRLAPGTVTTDIARVRQSVTTITESITRAENELSRDGNGNPQVTIRDELRSGIDRLLLDADQAEKTHNDITWPESIVNIFRMNSGGVGESFTKFRSAVRTERQALDGLPLPSTFPDFASRAERTQRRLTELRRRAEDVSSRASGVSCDFSDDDSMDELRRIVGDAGAGVEQADKLLQATDRCPGTTYEPPPPLPRPAAPTFTPTPRVFNASLDCGDVLELEAGGRTELCAVHVRGWDSNTRTPVEVRIQPPFSPASRLSASPGDTSMGGDVMYASGVQDRPGTYIFSEGWRAERGAPAGSTTVVVIVRQGADEVRLPLTLNVIARGAPTGSSLGPPTSITTGSGGPYCVWQYKLFGDPAGCWHLAAAGCSAPRYANRPAYVMVGSNMSRSEADRRVEELSHYFNDGACRATKGTDPFGPTGPNVNTNPPNPAGTPAGLSAELQCGGELEIVAGGRGETCGVRVRGWRSDTRTPVEIIFDPPFSRESRIQIAPGNTSQGGDALYASGVNDRFGEYVFGEGFSADRGAPETRNAVTVIVRQGNAEVRLPLQVNVVPAGSPPGISLVPPTPNVTGSGGPFCVWQYKLFGDPPPCWHLVAAGCTEPRYANRREYVMVGNNMSRSDADRRIGELSRYFNDMSCRQAPETEPPVVTSVTGPVTVAPPVAPPTEPPAPEPPPGPVSRFSRFGISPRDSTIKVGETIALKAYATANGAPDMVLTLDEREVRWLGDKPPTFTATAADAGRTFSITATGPAGERDTVRITVEPSTLPGILPRPPVPAPAPGPVVNGPAPAGALALIDKVIKPSRTDGQHVTTLGEATCETRFVEGPGNFRIASWSFGQPPPHLVVGKENEVTISASLQQEPRLGSQSYPNVAVIHFTGFDVTKDSAPAQAIITEGQVKTTPGRYRFTLRPGVTKAVIGFACDGPGTFATYTYGVK